MHVVQGSSHSMNMSVAGEFTLVFAALKRARVQGQKDGRQQHPPGGMLQPRPLQQC